MVLPESEAGCEDGEAPRGVLARCGDRSELAVCFMCQDVQIAPRWGRFAFGEVLFGKVLRA